MPTTRLSEADHARLQRLARETGQSYQEVLHRALETYERDCFLDALNASFAKLRADPKAWEDELAERSAWDVTSSDTERDS
jgi:predicted transcriptional regulator